MEKDREKYEKFYGAFGLQLKYGILNTYGANKDQLQDLLMYYSAANDKFITLKDYVEAMPEEQKYIYFAAGESLAALRALPQIEPVRARDYDVLFMTDDIDDFLVRMLQVYNE